MILALLRARAALPWTAPSPPCPWRTVIGNECWAPASLMLPQAQAAPAGELSVATPTFAAPFAQTRQRPSYAPRSHRRWPRQITVYGAADRRIIVGRRRTLLRLRVRPRTVMAREVAFPGRGFVARAPPTTRAQRNRRRDILASPPHPADADNSSVCEGPAHRGRAARVYLRRRGAVGGAGSETIGPGFVPPMRAETAARPYGARLLRQRFPPIRSSGMLRATAPHGSVRASAPCCQDSRPVGLSHVVQFEDT